MNKKGRLIISAGVIGAIYGIIALAILIHFVGPKYFFVVIAIPFEACFLIPLLSGISGILSARNLDPKKFGPFEGFTAAIVAYLWFTLFHGIAAASFGLALSGQVVSLLMLPAIFGADLFFGTILIGWTVPIIGVCVGVIYKRFVQHAL